jgi:DNA invertase Pin-like site-specific DNA recombinase
MRYAAYIRFSHENQEEGYTLDAQKRIIENYVKRQKGKVVEFYIGGRNR